MTPHNQHLLSEEIIDAIEGYDPDPEEADAVLQMVAAEWRRRYENRAEAYWMDRQYCGDLMQRLRDDQDEARRLK